MLTRIWAISRGLSNVKMSNNGYELFFGRQSPFSHHHACNFTLEDQDFHCMEQYMMYKKAEVFGDENIKYQVLNSWNPAEIKRLGRQVKDFDILKWMKVAVDIVKAGNKAKFSQNDYLKRELYKTCPKQMVEASPSDTRWGIGLSADRSDAQDESRWRGRNLLGKLLTNLRDEMMKAEGKIKERTLPLLESDQSAIEEKLLEENEKIKLKFEGRGHNRRSEKKVQSDRFEFFWGEESPFSNYHQADFEVDGVRFFCIEQFMLFRKAELFKDEYTMKMVKNIRMSGLRTRIDVTNYDKKRWMQERKDIYKEGVKEKFKQNHDLLKILFSTFPKIILRVPWKEQNLLVSNPDRFSRTNDYRHWSEFALMEVRDEMLGEDSNTKLGLKPRKDDKKRASDFDQERSKKQKKARNRQNSPDEYVDDVSNLFDETRPSESCLENEASSSRSPVSRSHDKMEIKENTRSSREQKRRSDEHSHSQSKFEFFWGDKSPFSNYHQADFEVDDVKFFCIEQYMLYRKADLFGDEKTMTFIKKMNYEWDFKDKIHVKKFVGRKWTEKKKDIYKQGVTEKFKQNPDLMKILLETSPKIILKASREDRDYLLSDPDQFRKEEWIDYGHWFEFALMEVRDRFVEKRVEKDTPNPADENVNDVSNNLDENLQIQTKNGQRASKSSQLNHEEKMEVDEEEKHTQSSKCEPKMDWFENEASITQTSHSKKGQKESPSEDSSQSPAKKAKKAKKENTHKKDVRTPKGHANKDQSSIDSKKTKSGNDKSLSQNVSNSTNADDKYPEKYPVEQKPTKNYRKLKLSSLSGDKKYTFIDNTNPLSFEAECKFTIDDIEFKSVEHYAAYRKADLFADDYTKDKIRKSDDSKAIRRLQGEVKNFNSKTWYENHADIHREACRAKFSQNPELKLKLFDTYPTGIRKSGKSSRGRVTEVDHKTLDKQDRNNKQDTNNVLNDVRDELMKKEGLIE